MHRLYVQLYIFPLMMCLQSVNISIILAAKSQTQCLMHDMIVCIVCMWQQCLHTRACWQALL